MKYIKSINKYILAAILIAVPLFPKFPLINIKGTFVAIRLEDFILLLAGASVIYVIYSNRNSFLKNPINSSLLLMLLAGLISLISAVFLTKTVMPGVGTLHWLRRIEYLIPFFLAYYYLKKQKADLAFFVKILILVILAVFIYGLGQKYFNLPVIITQNEEYSKGVALRFIAGSHLNSTFAGHYDLGSFLVMVLPIIAAFALLVKGIFPKLILIFTFSSGLWLLVSTASRISLFSYLVAVTLTLILLKRYKLIPLILIFSLLFTGFSANLLTRYKRIIEVTKENFLSQEYYIKPVNAAAPTKKITSPTPTPIPVFEDRSTNIRLNVEWPRAVRAFYKNPLLGTGYSSISLATDNDYLRLLGETGLIGFFAFFLVFLNIFIVFVKRLPLTVNYSGTELAFAAGVFGALPGVFINGFFIDVFEASKFAIIFWMFMGFTLALKSKDEQNN